MKGVIALILVVIIGAVVVVNMQYDQVEKRVLPILNPTDVNKALVDSSLHNKGLNHTILDFNLINQNGESVTQNIIKNKVVISDFFFTTCPGICPKMTNQIKRVHDEFLNDDHVIILSHTVWPEVDSAEVLKAYAELHDAQAKRWQFLTGDKEHLYKLARQSYLVAPSITDTNYDQGGEGDFIHTTNVALIDKKRQIRGFYGGTDSVEIQQLIDDIYLLLESNNDQ